MDVPLPNFLYFLLDNVDDESGKEDFQDGFVDTRFLEVCIDGDVEDLVQLFEEIARRGETLGYEDLNCADNSGRVSFIFNMKY